MADFLPRLCAAEEQSRRINSRDSLSSLLRISQCCLQQMSTRSRSGRFNSRHRSSAKTRWRRVLAFAHTRTRNTQRRYNLFLSRVSHTNAFVWAKLAHLLGLLRISRWSVPPTINANDIRDICQCCSLERLEWLDSCGVPVDVAIDALLDYNPQTARSDLDTRSRPVHDLQLHAAI